MLAAANLVDLRLPKLGGLRSGSFPFPSVLFGFLDGFLSWHKEPPILARLSSGPFWERAAWTFDPDFSRKKNGPCHIEIDRLSENWSFAAWRMECRYAATYDV